MHDLKDKIIADLRSQLDTALAVIRLMEENERLAEERHEHNMRTMRRLVDDWKEADAALKGAAVDGDPEECHNAYDKFNKTEEALRNA